MSQRRTRRQTMRAAATLLGMASVPVAARTAPQGGLRGVDSSLLEAARRALESQGAVIARRDRMTLVDLRQPSNVPRLHIVDLEAGSVVSLLVAHGRGSDPANIGRVTRITDEPGSLSSVAGSFRTGEPFQSGKNGPALFLDGLEPGNRNARAREIIIHSAPYVADAWVSRYGKPGRSWGCFVVSPVHIDMLRDRIGDGRLLFAMAPTILS